MVPKKYFPYTEPRICLYRIYKDSKWMYKYEIRNAHFEEDQTTLIGVDLVSINMKSYGSFEKLKKDLPMAYERARNLSVLNLEDIDLSFL